MKLKNRPDRFDKPPKGESPGGFLRGWAKRKIRGEIEVDYRKALLGKMTDSEFKDALKVARIKAREPLGGVATGDGGTFYPAPSSTWGSTIASTTSVKPTIGSFGGVASGTGWYGGATGGSSWSTTYKPWLVFDTLDTTQQAMVLDAICEQLLRFGPGTPPMPSWTFTGSTTSLR